MAEVALFHHAQGLPPGVVAFAEELRRAGHTVPAPDLYDGRIFATLEEGVARAKEIGFGEVMERGLRAVEGGPADQPGTSIVLEPPVAGPGVTDDERRTITEMMAKGNFRASRSSLSPTIPPG